MRDYTNTGDGISSLLVTEELINEALPMPSISYAWQKAMEDRGTSKDSGGIVRRPVKKRMMDIIGHHNILDAIANGVPEAVVAHRLSVTTQELIAWINEDAERVQAYSRIRFGDAINRGYDMINDLVMSRVIMDKQEVLTAKVKLEALRMARDALPKPKDEDVSTSGKTGVTVNINFGNSLMGVRGVVVNQDGDVEEG